MKPKALETRLRAVSAFAEADSGLDETSHGKAVFEGAMWLRKNAKQAAHAPELIEALERLMNDYNENYQVLTDGQYGKEPGGAAWANAKRLLKKLAHEAKR